MAGGSSDGFIPESGITEDHFEKFRQAAIDEKVIALVRHTNRKSTDLIKLGCPGKPMAIKLSTSESTGVVTAANQNEIDTAQREGYLVVDPSRRVARGYTTQGGQRTPVELPLQNVFWQVEPGQLIDGKLKRPLVGDYDLMSVIEPRNPGQNIALVASNGKPVDNVESPIVRRYKDRVNAQLDMPRIHHGAQDQYAGFRGGATAFLPDGRMIFLPDALAVEEFFDLIGRQTRMGHYPSPPLRRNGIRVVPARMLASRLKSKATAVATSQAGAELLGQSIGGFFQWLGDIGTRRAIQHELSTTHAQEIADEFARGNGVLVIVRMQEWIIPDFNGMRARGLLSVYVEGGPTMEAALDEWRKPKWLQGPPWGWRTYEEHYWLDPTY
jgi:hypothetical protein